jgi:hypothetical protein
MLLQLKIFYEFVDGIEHEQWRHLPMEQCVRAASAGADRRPACLPP